MFKFKDSTKYKYQRESYAKIAFYQQFVMPGNPSTQNVDALRARS